MWFLIIIAVNIQNSNDIPGKIQLQFKTQVECETALQSMTHWVKFPWFKIEGKCEKNTHSNR